MLLFLSDIWIGLDSRPVDYSCTGLLKCVLRSYSHTLSSLVLSVIDNIASDCCSDFVRLPVAVPRNGLLKDCRLVYYFFIPLILLSQNG